MFSVYSYIFVPLCSYYIFWHILHPVVFVTLWIRGMKQNTLQYGINHYIGTKVSKSVRAYIFSIFWEDSASQKNVGFLQRRTGKAVGRVGLTENQNNKIHRNAGAFSSLGGVISQNIENFCLHSCSVSVSHTPMTFSTVVGLSKLINMKHLLCHCPKPSKSHGMFGGAGLCKMKVVCSGRQ
jgi:hypothetical protein